MRLEAAVVDYSFTSSAMQIEWLVDKLQAMRVPTLVLLYCPHTGWHRHVHCGLDSRGYCTEEKNASATQARRPRKPVWLPAPPIQQAGPRKAGRGIRPGFGSSLSGDAAAVSEAMRGVGASRVVLSEEANATLAELRRLGLDDRITQMAVHRFFAAGWHAAADRAAFNGAEGVLAAAAAASFIRGRLSHGVTEAAAWLRRAVAGEGGAAASSSPRRWLDALSAVAAGECLSSPHHIELVRALEERRVPYASNAAQLSMLAEEVLARKGGWGAHPSASGHLLMALAVEELLRTMLRPRAATPHCAAAEGAAEAPASEAADAAPAAYPEQVCRYGQQALEPLVVHSRGFGSIDAGGEGRTGGLAATAAGAWCRLRLSSSSLQAGWLNLGYERGWRHAALATVACEAPCACAGLTINATNPKPYTGTAFTAPMWLALGPPRHHRHRGGGGGEGSPSGGYECVLRVDVPLLEAGRLLLQAATLSAPLPGNHSVALKDSLEVTHQLNAIDPLPFRRA